MLVQFWIISILIITDDTGNAVPIDNGIEGQPEVSCEQDSAKLTIKSKKPFYGHVYVKGQYRVNDCHLDLTSGQGQIPQSDYSSPRKGHSFVGYAALDYLSVEFSVSYRGCYVKRERSVNPPGLSYIATVVVQFHHLFATKVDRAYSVTCFYMETQKSVTYDFDVSMLSSVEIYQTRPMPICTYEIHRNGVTGPSVKFAQVGDQVYHKWTCAGGDAIYGMLVHSCVASDGSGVEYRLIDQTGCSIDPIAVGDLSYNQELSMAYVEVHVFKFADRMQVSFQCQISLCLKLENGCQGISPPSCPQTGYKHSYPPPAYPPSSTPPYESSSEPMHTGLYFTTFPTPGNLATGGKFVYPLSILSTAYPSKRSYPPFRRIHKRNLDDRNIQGTLDLTTDDIFIFNLDDNLPAEFMSYQNGSKIDSWSSGNGENRLCMSSFGLTQIIFAIILSFCILSAAIVYCQRRYYSRLMIQPTNNSAITLNNNYT